VYAGQNCVKWPFLTRVLQSISQDVQAASVDIVGGGFLPRYCIRVRPYPYEFWGILKLKFPDWLVNAMRYKIDFDCFSLSIPWFYSVSDLITWLLDTIRQPGIKNLLLLECTKYLPYQDVERVVR